jgi:NAD(P)-dependent dehydrogenase (short-subunit alcohol dehydrogenase family)
MDGRVCLVTGATSGIGRATALELSRRGATVHLVARDRARGEAALAEVARAGGGRARLHLADLSSMAAVRALAEEVRAAAPALHVLVNNAGAVEMERRVSPDGLEMTFAVNHLAYFLLTHLLLDLLRSSAPARVINVASTAHRGKTLDFRDLQNTRRYAGLRVYGQSKLANILFTRELARRLEGSGVTANSLHPGVVATGFGRASGGWMGFGVRLIAPLLLSPEQGAETTLYLACSPEVEGVSGQYFERCRPVRPSAAARDDAAARRLWEESARLLGLS